MIKKLPEDIFLNKEILNIFPISYVRTGSNVYGLSSKINQEFAGIHIMDTMNYLKHPDFREKEDILRVSLSKNNKLTTEDHKNKFYGITSFEIWKFISLYLNGSIVTYDILYLSPEYINPQCEQIMNTLRSGITNKIGISAKTYVMNNWQKDRTDQRKIIMSFYRLLQAITFLREEEYIINAKTLWEEYPQFKKYEYGYRVFSKFVDRDFEKTKLTEKEITGTAKELEMLIDEINKAFIGTRLPDTTPKKLLDYVMKDIVEKRMQLHLS